MMQELSVQTLTCELGLVSVVLTMMQEAVYVKVSCASLLAS